MGIVTTFVAAPVSNRTFLMLPSLLDVGFEPAEVDWHVRTSSPQMPLPSADRVRPCLKCAHGIFAFLQPCQ